MSVSDPLIKDIKGQTLTLFNESTTESITDSTQNLESFCQTLEKIFYKGLIHKVSFYGSGIKYEPFEWMCSILLKNDDLTNFTYKNCTEEVQKCKNVFTQLGKFRLLVRHCLMNKCLHFPLEILNESNKSRIFYDKNSIIGDEILSAILLSVLLQCKKINFRIELSNSYFLDSTWQLPDWIKLELVPCHSLGINISFSENKAVIVHIRPNSVASESGEISVGDILVNLNGIEINSSCKGRLNTILRSSKGRPINLIIVKAFHKDTQSVFQPLKVILRNLQIDLVKITNGQASQETTSEGINNVTKSGFKATYLGSVNVGNKGSVKQIEETLKHHLNQLSERTPVIIEIGEINISSCGSASNLPNYVAYIAGDKNCDTASNFICYIFYVEDMSDAYTILQSIGQGFYRTHFAV